MIKITTPEVFAPLFLPAPYKIYYGGRGSGKSYAFADALLVDSLKTPQKILCAREHQNSIGDSVHALLVQRIEELGIKSQFIITDKSIVSYIGSEFIFMGLRYNVDSVKSIPGLKKCWVEEAHKVSKKSWETLIPTLRDEASELWVSFNPEWEEDYTYDYFVTHANLLPPGSVCIEVNHGDNPYFPNKLRLDMEACKLRSVDDYMNIWEGKPRRVVDGAVYANELRDLEMDNRLTYIMYDRGHPVFTAWDIGSADFTAIWFFQKIANEIRIIDYFEASGHLTNFYLQELQKRGYVYDTHYMPHDADDNNIRGKSVAVQARAVGFKVIVTPRPQVKANGIEAVRILFPRLVFDREKTRQGRSRLASYRYEIREEKNSRSLLPLHDDSSHAADALQTLALGLQEPKKDGKMTPVRTPRHSPTSWMAN